MPGECFVNLCFRYVGMIAGLALGRWLLKQLGD